MRTPPMTFSQLRNLSSADLHVGTGAILCPVECVDLDAFEGE
jgi:hypothetical protein